MTVLATNIQKRRVVTLNNIVALIFALRAITFVWLAFASNEYMPWLASCVLLIRYATIPIGIFYVMVKQRYTNYNNLMLLIPLIIYYFMLVFNTYGGYKGSYIHELITIGCFLLMDREEKIRVFRLFYKIILIANLIAIFVYLVYIANLPIGFSTVPFFNDGVQTSYYKRFLIFAVMDSGYSMPRLCGIFNEPGGLGTVCGLLFAATFDYSHKWEKAVLIVSTILSLSLAGCILILTYLVFYYGKKDWRYSIIVVALIVFLIAIPYIDWGNVGINAFAQRFAFTSEGFAGDNRIKSGYNQEFSELLRGSEAFLGKGYGYTVESGTSSYKNFIMQFGIVGFGVFFIAWLIAAIKSSNRNSNCIVLLSIFLISLYQRPVTLTNSYGYVLIFGGFAWLQYMKEQK